MEQILKDMKTSLVVTDAIELRINASLVRVKEPQPEPPVCENYSLLTEFLTGLKIQENEPIYNSEELVYANQAPEDGGSSDIGYGHKLTTYELSNGAVYGLPIRKGITESEASIVMTIDFFKNIPVVAQSYPGIPLIAVLILAEYRFNGVYDDFPRFKEAISSRKKVETYNNYKRYWSNAGVKRELSRRNAWTKTWLDKLVEIGWLV